MTKELSIYSKINDPLEFVERMGAAMAKSQMFGCKNLDQGKVLAMACLAEGENPLLLSRRYHIIDNNLSMKYDAMLAELRTRGGKYRCVRRDVDCASVIVEYAGETYQETMTWDEAKKEPFCYAKDGRTLKKNWATPRARRQMLWARVVSEAVRVICPEIVAGVYEPAEIDDHQPIDVAATAENRDDELVVEVEVQEADVQPGAETPDATDVDIVAGEPSAHEVHESEPDTTPVCSATISELKAAIVEFGSSSSEVVKRIKSHLAAHGLEKLADMTQTDAQALLRDLQERAIERFFERSLSQSNSSPGSAA